MFHEQRRSVPDSVEQLRAEYDEDLAAAAAGVGVEAAVERTGLDRATVAAVADGDPPELTLEEAAAIQALAEDAPHAEAVADAACDHVLLGMSAAIVDVDTVAAELDRLDPKEVQQKIERRAPMSFEEFVAIQYVVADRHP